MMLNKSSRRIIKSLKGDYRKFAKDLISSVRSHCKKSLSADENLADILNMLAEAQTAGRDFADVIPEPTTMIRETVACFPIKKIRHLGAICSCMGTLVVCLCAGIIYATAFSPVPLASVSLTYNEKTQTVSWEAVPNASLYDVYLNGLKVDTVSHTFYGIKEFPEGESTVKIVAKGKGRYKDSVESVEIKVDYPTVAVSIFPFKNTYMYNARFCELASYYAQSPESNTLKVSFTPEYNFYGTVKADDSLRFVRKDGELLALREEMWFYQGSEYEFVFGERDVYANSFWWRVYVINILQASDLTLPAGKALYWASDEYGKENFSAYVSGNAGVAFASLDQTSMQEGAFYASFCPFQEGGFIVAENKNSAPVKLEVEQKINEVGENVKSGEMAVKRGYTAFRANWNSSSSVESFILYSGVTALVSGLASEMNRVEEEVVEKPGYGDFGLCVLSFSSYIVVRVDEDTSIAWERFTLSDGERLSGNGTFSAKPGLFCVVRGASDSYYKLTGAESFYNYDLPRGWLSGGELRKIEKEYSVVSGEFPYEFFFNPYLKSLEITVKEFALVEA